jgi:hypothetical protein
VIVYDPALRPDSTWVLVSWKGDPLGPVTVTEAGTVPWQADDIHAQRGPADV